jgi:hypothetical protein
MGKNQSASGLTNVIQYDNRGNISFVSGSTTLMQVSSSGAITTTGVISGSNALSASFSLNSALLNGTGSVGFATTASLLTVSSSQQQISASQQQMSASLLTLTASFNAVSSSQQQISASLLNVIAIGATTGSNSFRATQSITGSLTVTGQIIAQTLNVQQVTSSIIYSSGSNNFGCDLNSRQTFTGSVNITGSQTVFGNLGIGGAAGEKLGVIGPLGLQGFIRWSDGVTTSAFLGITGSTAFVHSNNFYLGLGANGSNNYSPTMMINNGNVGIGTCTPNRLLSMQGSNEAWIENTTTATTTQCWLFGQDGSRKGFEVYDINQTKTRFFVAPTNGNIGIGTTCIISAYGFEKTVSIESCNNAELQLKQTCNNNCFSIGITNGTNYFQSNQGYDFQVAGGTKLRIASSGNIGICNSSPLSPLSFNNTTGTKIDFYNDGNSRYSVQVNGGELRFLTCTTDYISLAAGNTTGLTNRSGKIGIGTTNTDATYLQLGDWCNRAGRLLTSNCAGWVGDGKTPLLLTTSGTDTSTCKGNAIGFALHNDSQTTNSWTPSLVFSRRSYSGTYNSAMATIQAQTLGCGVDANWNGGDLVFAVTPVGGYMGESLRLSGNYACFSGQVCAPQFTSGAGTVDNPYGSWTTLFTIPSGLITTYIVHAVLYNQGGYYTNTIMLGVNGSAVSVNNINNPGGACLRVNGYDVQVTNGSGATQSINYRYVRLG